MTVSLTPVNEGLFIIDHDHDLVFSPDDEDETGKGWYIQKSVPKPVYSLTSQLFETKEAALTAMQKGKLRFSE